jgi:hypothetical protein
MKTKNTAPIFFEQLTDFLHSLADRPQKHNQDSHPLFTPLLNSYLSHYQIDFHTQGLASTYSLWKSVMTSDQTHAADYTIVQQCWQVEIPKATVIIVHGYLDHSGLYGRLIRWSLEQNYNVICFDLPGHGLSSGEPANIDSFATYTHIFRQVIRNGIGLKNLILENISLPNLFLAILSSLKVTSVIVKLMVVALYMTLVVTLYCQAVYFLKVILKSSQQPQ